MVKKKNNKVVNYVDRETAKIRLIGGLVCLFALITSFFVGFFVGKFTNENKNVNSYSDITLTADNDYLLNGIYQLNSSLNLSSFSTAYQDFNGDFDFMCDINNNGILVEFNRININVNYNVTEKYVTYVNIDSNTGTYVYYWDKWGSNSWQNQIYRTIYVENQNVSQEFYNWFINNSTYIGSIEPPVITYEINYNFNNVISNGVDLPITVDSDKSYTLLFNTNGVDGYFPLVDYIEVTVTNCDYIVGYGNYGSVTDTGFIANLYITISNIVGDVNITFNGTSILKHSTVIYFTGDINAIGVQFIDLDNCEVYFNDNNVVIYPINLGSNYKYTIDILSYNKTINQPLINIINGSSYIVYDISQLDTDNEYDEFLVNFIIRSNSNSPAVQIRISPYNAEFDYISTSFVDWLITAIGGFFDFYIMPGLTLGLILGSIIVIAFVIWVIRVFMGG